MNYKILLFLLPGMSILIPGSVYGEIGSNYDKILQEDGSILWTSHYPRIWDGSEWKNYILTQDTNNIIFRSANLVFDLDLNTCSIKMNDIEYDKVLKSNSAITTLGTCQIEDVLTNNDGIQIITKQNGDNTELKTLYDINGRSFFEWTYEITNTDLLGSKTYSIEETCKNCIFDNQIEDVYYFGDYYLDTKNRVHNKIKSIAQDKDFRITYEDSPRGFLGKTIIDPTFGFSGTSSDRYVRDTGLGTPNVCDLATTNVANKFLVYAYNTGSASDCIRTAQEWDITSIPDNAIIASVNYKFEVSSVTNPRNCDFNSMESQPSLGTTQSIFLDVGDGTTFVNNDSTCTTTGIKTINLGSSANTDVQDNLTSDWWALGIKLDNEALDGADHFLNGVGSDLVGGTQAPQLSVGYFTSQAPEAQVSQTVDSFGDILIINGSILVPYVYPPLSNITDIVVRVNGTVLNTNTTDHNQTAPYTIKYGPIYGQVLDSLIKNITTTVTVQNINTTISNETKNYRFWEYGPDYFTADDPAEGTINYTFAPGNIIKSNRDKGAAAFQMECLYIPQNDAFFNTRDNSIWDNQTGIRYYTYDYTGFYYVQCYNDGELFTTILEQNYPNQLVPGLVIFDQLGGFVGAPSVVLIIISILSLATGRNFPIIIIIALSVTGILGAMELITFEPSIWVALIAIGGITLFGTRKFY